MPLFNLTGDPMSKFSIILLFAAAFAGAFDYLYKVLQFKSGRGILEFAIIPATSRVPDGPKARMTYNRHLLDDAC